MELPPDEDCLLRTTILGIMPWEHDGLWCSCCGSLPIVAYIGYSFAQTIISVERGGYCENCDTLILPGDAFDD